MSGGEPDPSTADVAYLSVREIRAALAAGRLSSRSLVETLIARIEAIDAPASPTQLRAVAAVAADALDVAQRCDDTHESGVDRGPLFGVPVMIKDNIEAVGLPGTAGSTALVGRPTRDAPLVTRLRDAGAIVLASTNLSQWANIRARHSTSGWSATGGLVGNPWALDRSAGGSSSGSGAAVAAGLTPVAVGTETDGSITCPASLNGVVGLKPTVGTVPGRYVVPISLSQDSAGPMGRSVDDVAALYGVLSATAPTSAPTPRFAVTTTWRTDHAPTDELIDRVVAELRAAGHPVAECAPAAPGEAEGGDEITVLLAELLDDLSSYLAERPGEGVRSLADVVAFENAHAAVELPFFGHDLFEAALAIGGRRGPDYAEARARNLEWATASCLAALDGVDVALAPAYGPAWKSDLALGGSPPHVSSGITTPPAITGWPIISVPVGFVDGLPVGLAMIARPHAEWSLLDAARIVESLVGDVTRARPAWRGPVRG
jgi:amidase